MRVFLTGFDEFWLTRVFASVEKKDIGTSKSQEIIFETVPFTTHNGESIIFGLFLVNERSLCFKYIFRDGLVWLIGTNHISRVP